MSSKTTSKELSIALKNAGAKQESDYKYARFPGWDMEFMPTHQMRPGKCLEGYASFDCHELLERLPMYIDVSQVGDPTELFSYHLSFFINL